MGVRREVSKNTRTKSLKTPLLGPFWVFLDFWGIFLRLFCGPPKRPFWRLFFFAISGPEGPETPVNGGSGRNFHACHDFDKDGTNGWVGVSGKLLTGEICTSEKTYWEHSKKKASREPLRARNSN